MSETVGDECDQFLRVSFRIAEQTVYSLYDHFDEVNVLPFVEAADVVGVGNLSFMEDKVYCPCMIFYKKPVADILTLSIDRKRLAVADIVDEKRDQFFRELVGTIIIGAVGDDRRHSVCVMVSKHEVVAACL